MIPAGTVYRTCNVCKGKGILPTPDGRRWQVCPRCNGRGKIVVSVDDICYGWEDRFVRMG